MRNNNAQRAHDWIDFLRQYCLVPNNQNMYDEFIRSSAEHAGVEPIAFVHPEHDAVLGCITGTTPLSVVLTGTAGDGKTHLCRRVWEHVNGSASAWDSGGPHVRTTLDTSTGARTLHVIRDLSAWVPQRNLPWDPQKVALLEQFCESLFRPGNGDLYLIAANDGQLVESWYRLPPTDDTTRARLALETLLVEDRSELDGVALRFFNLSRRPSVDLLARALDAFLNHNAWARCFDLTAPPGAFFGPDCPVRRNLELLRVEQTRGRLRDLIALCDANGLHLPIRQILLLLANAVLGHPDADEHLMRAADVPDLIRSARAPRASVFNNIFGGNLSPERRRATVVFDTLGRFGVGHETTNRVDNMLIFGQVDAALRPDFDRYIGSDPFYGADPVFRAAQGAYIEGGDDTDENRSSPFIELLVAQRRALFFKIPDDDAERMRLWELTTFKYAGEYLNRVIAALHAGRGIERLVTARLARGLNRVFTGMLLSTDRVLLMATGLALSQGRVNRLLEDEISVAPRLGESVSIVMHEEVPTLEVALSPTMEYRLALHLTRYEFLSRVADGILPSSFSRECYEDILAFKSTLLTGLNQRRERDGELRNVMSLKWLSAGEQGREAVHEFEVPNV
jgi:hypothetical protein